MKIGRRRLLLFTVTLSDEQDDLVFRQCRLDGSERGGAPDEQRDDYIGENDDIPKRQDRNSIRCRDGFIVALEDLRHARVGRRRKVVETAT